MLPLRVLASRLLAVFSTRRLDQRLDEEVQCHLEMVAAEKIREGMTPEDARAEARREFGGVEQTKETYRDARGIPLVESLIQDLRYAARVLRKSGLASWSTILFDKLVPLVAAVERRLKPPFGMSLFAVARKPERP